MRLLLTIYLWFSQEVTFVVVVVIIAVVGFGKVFDDVKMVTLVMQWLLKSMVIQKKIYTTRKLRMVCEICNYSGSGLLEVISVLSRTTIYTDGDK